MNLLISQLFDFILLAKKIIVPILILALVLHACDQKKEIDRMRSNTSALILENGKLLKTKKVLELNTDELKEFISSDSVLKAHLKDSLKIKEKNIKMLTSMVHKTETSFSAPLRDTTVLLLPGDTVSVYAKAFEYSSDFLQSSGIVYKDSVAIKYRHEDKISLVIHYTKNGKWFLPRLFEKAKLSASVINSDPCSDILIDKVIIKK